MPAHVIRHIRSTRYTRSTVRLGLGSLLAVGCSRSAPAPVPPAETDAEPVAAVEVDLPPPDDDAPEDLGPALTGVVDTLSVPGLGAAVFDREGTVALGVAGRRRVDEAEPVAPGDRFHLGSDTKAMTAYVVGRLVDRGTLSWDDRLGELFADDKDSMHPDFADVTLDELLTHRGGLVRSPVWAGMYKHLDPEDSPAQQRDVVARFALAKPPSHPPGERFEYSNLGYLIVGAALHARTGQTWEALMQQELFDPLGMDSCGFGPPSTPKSPDGVWSHARHAEGYRPIDFDNPLFLGPAGTVHCSLEDWGAFARAMFEHAEGLSAATRAHLTTPWPDEENYARGWITSDRFDLGETIITHDGSNTVNYASIVIAPKRGLAIVAACNAGDKPAQRAVVEAVAGLLRRYQTPKNEPVDAESTKSP